MNQSRGPWPEWALAARPGKPWLPCLSQYSIQDWKLEPRDTILGRRAGEWLHGESTARDTGRHIGVSGSAE